MNLNDWHKRWQQNHIGFHRAETNHLLVEYFDKLDMQPGDQIFVPLCGKSVDMLWLAEKGVRVVGVEVSKIACEAFFLENNLAHTVEELEDFVVYTYGNITIYAGDYFKLTAKLLGHTQAVYDRAALIALPADLRNAYVDHMFAMTGTEIKVLLLTMAYDQSTMAGPPFSVGPVEVESLYTDKLAVEQLYEKSSEQVAEHLRDKGLRSYADYVFLMS